MHISWVVATGTELKNQNQLDTIKSIGPVWGSWKTWRTWKTDSCICHDQDVAQKLIKKNFNNVANLILPKTTVSSILPESKNILTYDGNFSDSVENIEDVVAMHIAASTSELVLLMGFDFGLKNNQSNTYYGLLRGCLINTKTQWLAVDVDALADPFRGIANLTCDKLQNVLEYLKSQKVE